MLLCFMRIQDGCQKLRENNFWQKLADDSVYTLGVIEIALSGHVSKIYAFGVLYKNSK